MPKSNKIKNVIFLGRKPLATEAVKHLLGKGIKVKAIVAPEQEEYRPKLRDLAVEEDIPFLSDEEIYKMIAEEDKLLSDVDLVISYLFWKKIKEPLIKLGKSGCINFHPAPLPDYKNRAGYNTAILDRRKSYGASAHFIDSENFDSGPIIKVNNFPINPDKETAMSLEQKTQKLMLELFKEVVDIFLAGDKIKTYENKGGLCLSPKQLEKLKEIDLKSDSSEEINRKIRAFFFPPYTGAKVSIKGQDFTLINNDILSYIHKLINDKK
ncbi:hypothetical protein COT99_02345 [Candidatus Falkowbacteria bacterium CG10_big_fil_rev_8_21_14_0_10_43_10]|uniref:Formyl transferase N-terminal domain-containing protein n=1 Tax=Candidatus Falkowbacteria bacterium CG10_big_fil_rev_8_21_14_0_10_43_10 TaxID=1974567 RepID=A0A2H0V235_9BACT|nr:MAG: hypothetical protein COT99_02345 [Candidatus Falkowbacteria bacterium CG10_big_fil_rev_8_21_14_0_10_43_10]